MAKSIKRNFSVVPLVLWIPPTTQTKQRFVASEVSGAKFYTGRDTEGRVEPGLFYSGIDCLISAFSPTVGVDFSVLLLPRIHFGYCLRADRLGILRISSGDFVNPGQI